MKKDKVIPATFDPVFKALLTSEECREYLADLIHIVTKIPKKDIINNIVIKNSEHMNNKAKEKRKISDLIVDVLNNWINLEINKEYYEGLFSKNNAYQHKIASEQFLSGESYLEEKKIIQINFDMFTKFDERKIIKFMIMDTERHIIEDANYEKYHVNLDLINKLYYNKNELSKEDRELLLLTMEDVREIEKIVEDDDTMKKAKEKLVDLSEDTELVGMYDKEIVERKVNNTKLISARNEGIKEGMKKGKEQGIKEGLKQGIDKTKKDTVINMLKENIDIKTISKVTGMSENEILKLKG